MAPQLCTLAFAGALAALASASPVSSKVGTFSVAQVPNTHFRPHGPAQMAKTLAKYGVSLPHGLAQTVAKLDADRLNARDSGSVKATPEDLDIQYVSPVEIGSPPQVLYLDFDSGSSDLWVFSTATPPSSVNGQILYDPRQSNTSKQLDGAVWQVTYGDQSSSSGIVYLDTVSVGGIVVEGQAVEVATKVSPQFTRDSYSDGLLGLAFSSLNSIRPNQELTWFDNVAKSLDSTLWTADLKYHQAGSYDFGYIDKSKYTGSITYVDVDSSNGFWMCDLDGFGVGNTAFAESSFQGIADTGTTLAMLPKSVVESYYGSMPDAAYDSSQGGYVFPCYASPPDLTLGVGGLKITIPGKYINYAPIDERAQVCFGGIQSNKDIGFSILGDIVLKAAFVVFDTSSGIPRLGWAAKKL